MKNINLLSMVVALVLMVTAVSCTTMREIDDEYYDRPQSANRIYVDDPYRGIVVLERDPYSGRYYEVNTYNRYSSPYGSTYGRTGRYGSYNGRRTYSGRNNNNYRNNNSGYQTPQKPTQEQVKEREKSRDEARKKVLGN